jgi:hypothetical protein
VKAAFGLLCACVLEAQTVTVTGNVTNAITHEPIASVSVILQSAGPTLGANSDASGRFRIVNVKPGKYRLLLSRAGFERAPREIVIEAGQDPPPFDLTMLPGPAIRGRVLDPERSPAASIRVRAIQVGAGSGMVYEVTTDSAGRFAFDRLEPGEYTFLATPPGELAPTYFPGVTDKRDAVPVRLAAGDDLSGYEIALRAVPVFRVSGRVLDELGEPAVGATVQTGDVRRKATAREDGTFELRVLRGEAVLRADWQRGDVKLRGFAKLALTSHDVEALTVRLAPPVAVSGTIELDGQPGHECQGDAFLRPVDGQGEFAAAEFNQSAIRFESVYPGQYRLMVEPGWRFTRHYLDSVWLGERDITVDELEIAAGMTPFRVALRTGGGRLRGTVENGNGGQIVLVPREERLRVRPFIVIATFEGGSFALDNVRPGNYFAFAVPGSFNAEEMYLDSATPLRLERDSTATLTLTYRKSAR